MSSNPFLSSVILNWNRSDLLRITMDSYLGTVSVPFELIVIDNGSEDDSRAVISALSAKDSRISAILFDENLGGEAVNVALARCCGRLLHISENDIEYLAGWSDRVWDYFEVFPQLGQLSPFGPVPTDEEVWELHPSLLRHSKGRILYQTDYNVGTSCIIRKEVFDRGIRLRNLQGTGKFNLPDDIRFSKDIREAGFMVAFADHYLVRNMGHFASEFETRKEYYSENYRSKPWMGDSGWQERLAEWESRNKVPSRTSFLIEEKISPEKSTPSNECPQPQLWSMIDGWTAEIEALEFLYSLVRLIKPRFVVETGTWHGHAAAAMGKALRDNGLGVLVSLEIDQESYAVATENIRRKNLEGHVRVLNKSTLDYRPIHSIELLLLDSELSIRVDEFYNFMPSLRPGSVVVFHDTSVNHGIVRKGVQKLLEKGLLQGFFFPTPRGLAIFQYTGKSDVTCGKL